MGKSGRKSKEKKKDFQKVKLKVGKSKPAANNVTKATFKTGGVLIREQLKQDDSQPTTQRKQNIHELICQLNHYNAKVRQDSLWGMKELLTNHPDLMSEHLALLLDNICTLFTDKEASVRKATITLLGLLFTNTNENDMSPFMSTLIVYLCSAMTHINESVQLDSLSVLDLCLDSYPNLIVPHSQELLMNFISQITRQRSMKPDFENADLELIVNPDRKMTSQTWRLKVLERLRKFLQSLLVNIKKDGVGKNETEEKVPIHWDEANHSKVLHFKPFLLEGFALRSLTSDTKSQSNQLSSARDIASFVNKVIPLLMQSWMEVSPSLLHTESGLLPVAIETLEAVGGVLCLLLKWLQAACKDKDDFEPLKKLLAQHEKEFIQRLFTLFPYIEDDSHKSKKRRLFTLFPYIEDDSHKSKKRKTTNKSSVQSCNLALAEIMTYIIRKNAPLKGWSQRLLDHLIDELHDYLLTNHIHLVLYSVQRLIYVLNESDSNALLKVLCNVHKKLHQKSQARGVLLRFLSDIAMQELNFESVNNWVSDLPNELQRLQIGKSHGPKNGKSCDVSDLLQVISKAVSRGHQRVLQGLQENILKLIDHQDGLLLHITVADQRSLIQLLYWVPEISKDILREIAKASMDQRFTCDNISFAFQLLTTRCLNYGMPDFEELLTCLLTSSLGVTMEMLIKFQDEASFTEKRGFESSPLIQLPNYCEVLLKSCDSIQYYRQTRICKAVCDCFRQLENNGEIWLSLQQATHNLLKSKKILPITSAQSVLRNLSSLYCINSNINIDLCQTLAHCCLALLLTSVTLYETLHDDDHWSADVWTLCVDTFLTLPTLLHLVLELMDCGIQDVVFEEDIYKTAIVIVRLLQTQSLASQLVIDASLLHRISHNIQSHPLCPVENQWKVELNYELRLLSSSAKETNAVCLLETVK